MFAVIYIPDFSLQAVLRFEPELIRRPVGLIDESLPKPVIAQLTAAARASGVCDGMSSTQAMARCRDILIKARSPAQETAAADILLQCSFRFSPYVEATAPGICTLDLKGQPSADFSPLPVAQASSPAGVCGVSPHELYGIRGETPRPLAGEDACATDAKQMPSIVALLDQFHLRAQIGVAATPAVALHAARCATSFLQVNDATAFLSSLPIESLNPSPQLLTILQRWGLRAIGEFLRLGKDALAERLGVEALELFSRASTTETRPLKLAKLPEVFEETFEFENEIESLEPLLFILRRFLEQIALRLSLECFAAEEILLRLILSEGSKYERPFKIPAPTTDVNVLFRVLFTHLENVRTEHPIKALYLRAKPCHPTAEQFGLFDCALRDPNHFYETLGRLTALLGPERVGIPVPLASYRPDAFEVQPVNFEPQAVRARSSPSPPSKEGEGRGEEGFVLRRFRPPIPAQVELHEKHPSALHSSLFRGSICQCAGPWRSSGQWWDTQLWHRDEWDVQASNGRLYRLFREHDAWFVEGVYD